MTAQSRENFAKTFVITSSSVLDRVKLLALINDTKENTSAQCKVTFDKETKTLGKLEETMDVFLKTAKQKAGIHLKPALKGAVDKGTSNAQYLRNEEWGCKGTSTGKWSTFKAVMRRDGKFESNTSGWIGFNGDLHSPFRAKLAGNWSNYLQTVIPDLIDVSEREVVGLFESGFIEAGIDAERVGTMQDSARKTCVAREQGFFWANSKRCEQRATIYQPILALVRAEDDGTLTWNIRKDEESLPQGSKTLLCTDLSANLWDDVDSLIVRISAKICSNLQSAIFQGLDTVFSVCWENLTGNPDLIDLEKEVSKGASSNVLPYWKDPRRSHGNHKYLRRISKTRNKRQKKTLMKHHVVSCRCGKAILHRRDPC
eukprot:scaffold6771_cov158-Amphora_coffeaeformis.AAC.7